MDDLDVLSTFFQDAAQGVLEGLPTDARSKVLIAVPKAAGRGGGAESNWHGVELLGTPLKHTSLEWLRKVFCSRYVREAESADLQPPSHHPKSILDVAIELQNKEFVAHPYCQNVLDDFWCGRSAKCGKVALHLRPQPKSRHIVFQVLILLLILPVLLTIELLRELFGPLNLFSRVRHFSEMLSMPLPIYAPFRVLATIPNDRYRWQRFNQQGDPEFDISVVSEMLQLFYIPLVKRIVFLMSHLVFTTLFIIVALQPLCGPMNGTHFAFGIWLLSRVFHLLHHLIFRGAQWRRGAGTLVDIFTSVTLLSASVLRISLDTELLESMGVAPPFTARSQLGWYVGEVARANPPNASHTTLGEARDIGAMGDTGICNWSPHYEVLRVLFALAAILLSPSFSRPSSYLNIPRVVYFCCVPLVCCRRWARPGYHQ